MNGDLEGEQALAHPAAGSHSNGAARAATGRHPHEARHDNLHAGAIPAPLGDGHRAPPTNPAAGAAAHVKVDYEGDHAQGHHLDARRVPDQQAVTDRHAAAHAPDHDRGAQDNRTPCRAPIKDRSPCTVRRDPSVREESLRAMESQYPALGTHHGNYLHTSRATLESYRSLPPDIKRRAGERTSKKDLSLQEHVCGLLNMALKIMDPTTEEYAAIEHMAQVAQYASTMQWNIVRGWSKACLAHLEGGATWADSTLFKEERIRL